MTLSQGFISEFIGTALLVLLGNGVVAGSLLPQSKSHDSGWITITFGWAMAVTVAVYSVEWLGPAHLNPAVTIAMALSGAFAWNWVIPFIIAQVLGAMFGALLVWITYLPLWQAQKDNDALLSCFATQPAVYQPLANMITELIGTFVLIMALHVSQLYELTTAFLPIFVGILVFAIGLSLGGPTGYAINPARDFGPRLMYQILPIQHKSEANWRYAWVPIVGPILGAMLATVVWMLLAP